MFSLGHQYNGMYWSLGSFLSNGGGILSGASRVIVDCEENVETCEFLKELYKYMPPGLATYGYDDWDKAFYLGKVAI